MTESEQRGAGQAPSGKSVLVMAAITFLAIYGTFRAAMTGETFDGRNLVGFLLGLLASVTMILQTANRFHRRLDAIDAERARRYPAPAELDDIVERDDEVDSDA